MILFGKDTITKRVIGTVSQRECINCHKITYWELCQIKVWITIFYMPIIPYCKKYALVCNDCDYYVELKEAEFEKIKNEILSGSPRTEPDSLKYLNKNSVQLNYIKTIEAYK